MMLLSGDLFDGPWTADSLNALRGALEEAAVAVFISPGNHDFCSSNSPYLTEIWPKNVHIFTNPEIQSVVLENLDCRVYGAGYRSMDCGSLLKHFRAEGNERYHIGVLHGDPTQINSPYCPVTALQVRESGLHYLALGHIHKSGSFRSGDTLCAWPGSPMGRGYDEQDVKGCMIVTVGEFAHAQFVPLDTPRFYDHEIAAGNDPLNAIRTLLPAVGDENYYRVTLTGESTPLNLNALSAACSHFPNLELRDNRRNPAELWASAGEDSLRGAFIQKLKDAHDSADEISAKQIELAADIAQKLLDGREVTLP
jgi:DNA repair exonuclease SbcCD nuclease subunit